jgi:bifunctional DNA-binding transcriptional regulator/antitoxin component of YhaV-PrlF toxin-antitoxin module
MTVTVKSKTPLVVPPAVRRQAGLKSGQEIEFKVSGGVISIRPKLPNADDEYTPAQRRIVDAQLAEGLADIKAGRTFGPFDSADEMIAHMKAQLKKRATAPKAKLSR